MFVKIAPLLGGGGVYNISPLLKGTDIGSVILALEQN